MRIRIILTIQTLAILACVAQLQTIEPSPTTLPPTDILTLLPSSTVPVNTATIVVQPPTATATLAVVPTTALRQPVQLPVHNPYAVILVSPGDVLNIRASAGVTNVIAGTLPPTAQDVGRTGSVSTANGERWVEIQSARGNGWVNASFLTEQVASSSFCADNRVTILLNHIENAVLNSDGELLSSLISPVHGLDVRLWRYGNVANYGPEEAAWMFQSDYLVSWGPAPGSGEETTGSFKAQLLPKLQEVLSANYTLHCNDTLDLATFSLEAWPPEYSNINYYMVYKTGSEQYGGMDWRAWTIGVEYVEGAPTLFSLIHYQWEP